MVQYTTLTKEEIEVVLENFSMNKLVDFKILVGGSVNTNYYVKTESGAYVLTVCEQKSETEARELAQLLEFLERCHFETSKIIRSKKNDSVIKFKGKYIMLKEFIDGEIQKELPHHLIELIGREIGKLHKIKAPEYLPKQLSFGKEQFVNVGKYAAQSSFDVWLKEKLASVQPYFSQDVPKALIHADVFFDNVIISKDKGSATIMDFEEAAYYYRVFDLGMAIIGSCAEGDRVNFKKVRSLLKGYRSQIDFLDIEIEALQAFTVYAGAAMTFWRHINFNYTKPDPSLSDHYLGLKVLVDHVDDQSADFFQNLCSG